MKSTQLNKAFYLINLSVDNSDLLENMSQQIQNTLRIEITENNRLSIFSNSIPTNIYTSLDNAKKKLDATQLQLIVEYDISSGEIQAIHEGYFATQTNGDLYKIELNHLYLSPGKYSQEINSKRLFDSITFGILKELGNNISTDVSTVTRGLGLTKYLALNAPAESYKITRKEISSDLVLKNNFKNALNIPETISENIFSEAKKFAIPAINLDNIDFDELQYALENVGTIELTGPSMERFKLLTEPALEKCKEIFALPMENLMKVKQVLFEFNGFQNVKEDTTQKYKEGKLDAVRNQYAFNFKPYMNLKNPKIPEGIDMKIYDEYYHQGLALLYVLLHKIAMHYHMDLEGLCDYITDEVSVLTSRKYFPADENDKNSGATITGIPEHTDFGGETLVVTREKGLEVKIDGKWVSAPHEPGLKYYVNIGDWLGLILRNLNVKATMGIHRVPEVEKPRYSMALFFNPNRQHKIKLGEDEISYGTYLTDRTPYQKYLK